MVGWINFKNYWFSCRLDVIMLDPVSVIRLALNFTPSVITILKSYISYEEVDFYESLINLLRSVLFASTYATIIIYHYVDYYWRRSQSLIMESLFLLKY